MFYKTINCVVLKSVGYRDADKIYTLYSREEGKISAKAKGVRRISSRRAGNLDTLNLVELSYFQDALGHKTITEVRGINSFRGIKERKDKVNIAYKIVGLLTKNLEEELPDSRLFAVLTKTLSFLDSADSLFVLVLLYFYLNLIQSLGYSLQLKKCVFCEKNLSPDWKTAFFSLEKGGLVCPECQKYEEEIGLRGSAILNKSQDLKIEDFSLLSTFPKSLNQLEEILIKYITLKAS